MFDIFEMARALLRRHVDHPVVAGYKLARADIVAYLESGFKLVRGRLNDGYGGHCSIGVLYAASGLRSVSDDDRDKFMTQRYDGAMLDGIVGVNDASDSAMREVNVLQWLDDRIAANVALDKDGLL